MLDLNFTVQHKGFTLRAKLTLPRTGVFGIIGPSGAGKSTLIGAISGFESISSGSICWGDERLDQYQANRRPISTLFQDNNLFPHLTIARNLGLVLSRWPWLRHGHKAQISEALSKVGLEKIENRYPSQLSGGQHSRVALARVLLQKQPILLLDEPFSALGPAMKQDMLKLVAEIAKNHELLVLMVTHDPNDAHAIAPNTIIVNTGKTVTNPLPTKNALDPDNGPLVHYLGDFITAHNG